MLIKIGREVVNTDKFISFTYVPAVGPHRSRLELYTEDSTSNGIPCQKFYEEEADRLWMYLSAACDADLMEEVQCPNCNGDGYTYADWDFETKKYAAKQTCPHCNGKGALFSDAGTDKAKGDNSDV